MINRLLILFAFVGLITLNSCETDFSLNGDYKRIPVVFGLLDQSDSIHYIKITRTFLGDGNNNEFAQIPDSSYFDAVDAQIIEFDNNVETGRVWQLTDTIIPNKESGTFYAPNQKVYMFIETELDETMEYKLVADLDEGDYSIDAKTELIEGFKYSFLVTQQGYTMSFGTPTSSSANGNYPNLVTSYDQGKHASLYNTRLIFSYRETLLDGSTVDKAISWSKGDEEEEKPENPGTGTLNFGGEEFYVFIQNNISTDANVTKRQFLGMGIETSMAHTEFAKYMEISQPTSSIAQSSPQYTNINSKDGDALGLFSSRNIVSINNIGLSPGSIQELCTGQYTGSLNFCSNNASHIDEPFYCAP